jgi:glycosyltransferase involved in cell wall biosynthesis
VAPSMLLALEAHSAEQRAKSRSSPRRLKQIVPGKCPPLKSGVSDLAMQFYLSGFVRSIAAIDDTDERGARIDSESARLTSPWALTFQYGVVLDSRKKTLTVLIPTRNRDDVLFETLKTVLRQNVDGLEVIVSDNAGEGETASIVDSFGDSRIRHVNPGRRLSMSHNWEFALSHACGEYICLLGDDDALIDSRLPEVLRMMVEENADALASDSAWFHWPRSDSWQNGWLSVPKGEGMEWVDSRTAIIELLNGDTNQARLPMLYTGGIIRKTAIERVVRQTSNFFQSAIPDVYSAVAIASITSRYLFLRSPFAIHGISSHSNGNSLVRDKGNPIAGAAFTQFASEQNIPFHRWIPCDEALGIPLVSQAYYLDAVVKTSSLRGENAIEIDFYDQLCVVLRHWREISPDAMRYGEQFAKMHGLNLGRALELTNSVRSRRKQFLRFLHFLLEQTAEFNHTDSYNGLPLLNVSEAASAAASMLRGDNRPKLSATVSNVQYIAKLLANLSK